MFCAAAIEAQHFRGRDAIRSIISSHGCHDDAGAELELSVFEGAVEDFNVS